MHESLQQVTSLSAELHRIEQASWQRHWSSTFILYGQSNFTDTLSDLY